MCGRYTHEYTWQEVHDFLDLRFPDPPFDIAPSYNVAPSQLCPVCRAGPSGERELVALKWGFLPFWSKDPKRYYINARSETVASSNAFRAAFKRRRCLVPASAFYEWKKLDDGKRKQPYYIHLLNDAIFCFGGIWEHWQSREDGSEIESFGILTCTPNELMKTIHNRMPVILRPDQFDEWLDPGRESVSEALLQPFPAEEMEAIPVSTRVNSPKNNDASLIDAIGT